VLRQTGVRMGFVYAAAGILLAACGSKAADQRVVEAGSGSAPAPADAAADAVDAAKATPVRPEHAAFALVDNRHAAHRYYAGDIVIDAADVGFAKYTRFGVPAPRWQIGTQVGGVRAATADREAALEIPMDAEMARQVDRVELRVHAKAKQLLAMRINGRPVGKDAKSSRVELADGWQTVTLKIDSGRLGVGENVVLLETAGRPKDRISIEWLRFASKGKEVVGDPRAAATFDARAGTIALARDATLLWYVTIPEGAHLVAEVKAPCKLEVRATTSDDSFVGGEITAAEPRVDLTKLAGRVTGLTVTARDCGKAVIRAPEIRLHGPAPAPAEKTPPPKYIVLWVMDALRADKVPAFTPGARAKTPNLDELAKTSAVFRQYYVQGNESQTSHASMWTGLYPAVHQVRFLNGGSPKLDVKLDVLAAKLADAGMTTVGVTGNGFVIADNGYARGFREYRNLMRETGLPNNVIYGDKIVDVALARLAAHRDRPAFLFFGTIDTHAPWIARKPWIDQYSPNYTGPFQDYATADQLGFKPDSMGCSIIPPAPEIERLRAIYDSAVSYQDQLVGKVVQQLQSWGIWDQTVFVITSDHGEEMFEDRRCGHGGSLRESLVRVPLLVHDPSRFPAGTVIEEGVESIDLMPTLLDAMGAATPDAVQGESLVARAHGAGRGWVRPSYASMYEYAHAMRIGRWKITVGPSGILSIVDLVADPGETVDVTRKSPVERRMLTDNLGVFLALRTQWNKRTWGVTTNVTRDGATALDTAAPIK
jgi:arylsulfatase A-like enzyme